jgi:mannitol/fructose-specific phosphotransferase system IIA component (Ntr-type)
MHSSGGSCVRRVVFRVGGAYWASVWGGIGRKNSMAVAVGLNTQGTMGIIIGLVGLELGIFNQALFSSVVIVCVLTSLMVGPLLKWAIKGVLRPLSKHFDTQHVFFDVEGLTKADVIHNITGLMAEQNLIEDREGVEQAIWDREKTLSTAIGEGVAVPHARLPNQKEPILCFFRLKSPVDFGSPDDVPVSLLFLELTDADDDGMQLNLLAQVAKLIASPEIRRKLQECDAKEHVNHIMSIDSSA